jgi:hypothetical protein
MCELRMEDPEPVPLSGPRFFIFRGNEENKTNSVRFHISVQRFVRDILSRREVNSPDTAGGEMILSTLILE